MFGIIRKLCFVGRNSEMTIRSVDMICMQAVVNACRSIHLLDGSTGALGRPRPQPPVRWKTSANGANGLRACCPIGWRVRSLLPNVDGMRADFVNVGLPTKFRPVSVLHVRQAQADWLDGQC